MADSYKKAKTKSTICWTIAIIFAVVQLLIAFIPFMFLILNSLKEEFDMLMNGVLKLPQKWVFENYPEVIRHGFMNYFLHSVLVVGISLAILLTVTLCASYPLARLKFRMAPYITAAIIAMMAVPVHVTLIPLFKMATTLNTYDTIWGLIGPYVAFATPISVFIMTGFMKQSIPKEIEEAAEIDGCSLFGIFFKVIVPLSKPGLSTLAIYNGVSMWNEFVFANTLTKSVNAKTVPLALAAFKGENTSNRPLILTVLSLSAFPMIVLFLIFQDKLVKGMTAGAVKG